MTPTLLLATALTWLVTPPPEPERLKVGSASPPLSVDHWVKGDPVSSLERGQVYVVEFWATWCGPCIKGFPHVSELQEKYGDDVVIMGISDEKLATVEAFLEKPKHAANTRYTMGTDPDRSMHRDFMDAAQQRGIPTAFIIDREGIIQYIGHPMAMDRALHRVVTGEEPESGGGASDVDLEALMSFDKEHTEAAAARLSAMEKALGSGTYSIRFKQTLVAPGAMKMGGPDGEAMDLTMEREGDILVSDDHGVRIEAKKAMKIPGMPDGMGMEENEVIVFEKERILAKRRSMMMPDERVLAIDRAEAAELAGELPMPPTARMLMDMNPLLANPIDGLRAVLELCALDVGEEQDGLVELSGEGAMFLSMAPPEEGADGPATPQVSLTLDGETGLPVRLQIGDGDKPQFTMILAAEAPPETIDPALFTLGDEEPGSLAEVLREQVEMMRSMGGG